MEKLDFVVHDEGAFVLVEPVSDNAVVFVQQNARTEGWQWLGSDFAIDRQFAETLIEALKAEGFAVGKERPASSVT